MNMECTKPAFLRSRPGYRKREIFARFLGSSPGTVSLPVGAKNADFVPVKGALTARPGAALFLRRLNHERERGEAREKLFLGIKLKPGSEGTLKITP